MTSLSEAARMYAGTPFRHRGRSKSGSDCAGLPKLAYAYFGIELPDFLLYGREPHKDGLVTRAIAALGEPVAVAPVKDNQLRVDDVVLMRYEKNPHHVAIMGEHDYYGTKALTIIHADGWAPPAAGKIRPGKVHEQRLTPDMISRITHVFRRPV